MRSPSGPCRPSQCELTCRAVGRALPCFSNDQWHGKVETGVGRSAWLRGQADPLSPRRRTVAQCTRRVQRRTIGIQPWCVATRRTGECRRVTRCDPRLRIVLRGLAPNEVDHVCARFDLRPTVYGLTNPRPARRASDTACRAVVPSGEGDVDQFSAGDCHRRTSFGRPHECTKKQ